MSQYICGMFFEGTSTEGLQSECDNVIVGEASPVVEHLSEAQKYPYCSLMVQDSSTQQVTLTYTLKQSVSLFFWKV